MINIGGDFIGLCKNLQKNNYLKVSIWIITIKIAIFVYYKINNVHYSKSSSSFSNLQSSEVKVY